MLPSPTVRYEQCFAAAAGAEHAVAFAYARTALVAILRALGLQQGDGVVLSPLTCKVVPLALLGAGLRPVYADIDRDTLNLDATAASAAAVDARAILFQHTYGSPAGVGAVAALATRHEVPLVEDCAQCLPQMETGAPGTFGVASIFSNNPGKPLPAGSGGLALVRDHGVAERIRRERDALPARSVRSALALRVETTARNRLPHALYWLAYDMNRRLRDGGTQQSIAAEIAREVEAPALTITAADARRGEHWLGRLEMVRAHRAAQCTAYAAALQGIAGVRHITADEPRALYYYPVLVDNKDELLHRARKRGVQLVAWPIRAPIYPVEDEASLRRYGYEPGSCPVAEHVARELLGLPTDLATRARELDAVIQLVSGR